MGASIEREPLAQRRLETLRGGLRERIGFDPFGPLAPDRRKPREHVIVVGAGFGGLSAAYAALHAGFGVTVLEATDRVGGRVHSSRGFVPGRIIEFGAELIGWNHTAWMGYAETFGLGFAMLTDDDAVDQLGLSGRALLKGKLLSAGTLAKADTAMEAAEAELVKPSTRVPPYRPWDARGAAKLDRIALRHWVDRELKVTAGGKVAEDTPRRETTVRAALEALYSNDNCAATANQSLLAVLAAVNGGGGQGYFDDTEVMRCATGNDSLARGLAEAITGHASGRLSLYTAVTAIDVRRDGVLVSTDRGPVAGDYVVLAVPPTVWHRIRMPAGFVEKEHRVSGGPGIKFFSAVRDRFWLRHRFAPGSLSDVGETWEGTDGQICDGAVLSLFAGGPTAQAAVERKGDREYFAETLERLYPGYRDALVETHFQDWPAHPWIQWGYSTPAPGEVLGALRNLSEPFRRRLVFAGEHTNPAFFGYMEGALQSGLLALDQIGREEKLWRGRPIREALESAAEAGWQR